MIVTRELVDFSSDTREYELWHKDMLLGTLARYLDTRLTVFECAASGETYETHDVRGTTTDSFKQWLSRCLGHDVTEVKAGDRYVTYS